MNKQLTVRMFLISMLVAGSLVAAAAEPPKTLTWADLVNHPERWPAEVKLAVQLKFGSDVLRAGTVVRVKQVTAKEVELIAPQVFTFTAGPEECDLLQAANALWATLTPEQQSLTLQAIQRDRSLWPGKVKFVASASFGSTHFDAGTLLPVVNVEGDKIGLFDAKSRSTLMVSVGYTDLFSRSRELVAMPLDQRSGRMAELLAGTTVDSDGKPVAVQPAHYFVIYFTSYTCPRSKIFTPKLVDHFNKSLADRKDVAFVTLSQDASTPLLLNYVRQNAIPWPTIPAEKNDLMMASEASVMSVGGVLHLPGILILDRFGTPLLATSKLGGQPLEAANTALAQLNTVLK